MMRSGLPLCCKSPRSSKHPPSAEETGKTVGNGATSHTPRAGRGPAAVRVFLL